jgi:hypothetical protein
LHVIEPGDLHEPLPVLLGLNFVLKNKNPAAERNLRRGLGWLTKRLLEAAHTQVRRGAQQHAQQAAGVEHIFIEVNYTITSSWVNLPDTGREGPPRVPLNG